MYDKDELMKELQRFIQESGVDLMDTDAMDAVVKNFNALRTSTQGPLYEESVAEQSLRKAWKAVKDQDKDSAIMFARKALKLDPALLDAGLLELTLRENEFDDPEYLKRLNKMIANAEPLLREQGLFGADIEDIWYVLELRPFLRAKAAIARRYFEMGCFSLAAKVFENILSLNPNDNMGCRYHLYSIYALLEDFDHFQSVSAHYEQENDQSCFFLLPSAIIHHKLGEERLCEMDIKRLLSASPCWRKGIEDGLVLSDDDMDDALLIDSYELGSEDEMLVCLSINYQLLVISVGFLDYIEGYVASISRKK